MMTKNKVPNEIIVQHGLNVASMRDEVHDKIVEAFQIGASIAQISRSLMSNSFQFAYRVIQLERLIGNAPTRYHPQFVPEKLLGTFKTVKHSFPKWAISHHFDISRADKALARVPRSDDQFGLKVHQALRNDFRYLYQELYMGAPPKGQVIIPGHRRDAQTSLKISWREDLNCYVAQIPEMPKIWAPGETIDIAFRALKFTFKLHWQVFRLNNLIREYRQKTETKKIAVWE